jgi:Zn-dependent peptidase ImmA (M78 family)
MAKHRNTLEMEANIFATLLLVPEQLLIPRLQRGMDLGGKRNKYEKEDIVKLADEFDVPLPVMVLRLQLLNKKYPKGVPDVLEN